MTHFADRLFAAVDRVGNPTVLGLDPKLEYVPGSIRERASKTNSDPAKASAEALLEFNRRLIDAVSGVVAVIKPQFAYYEMYGPHGMQCLADTIHYAQAQGMVVIADAKRNDIGPTAEAYAKGILGETTLVDDTLRTFLGADAVTLNGYLGIDGIAPFLAACDRLGKGIFVLVRTSNPSAVDFQDLPLADGRPFYEAVASKVDEWGATRVSDSGYSSVGAVVGATWPEQARRLRTLMPRAIILVPGYGAQGATADDAAANFDGQGRGAVVNASRSLMCAHALPVHEGRLTAEDFESAARTEALRMQKDLMEAARRRLNHA
jgi:orotidine-5'-phosphate decarboxylase